MKLSALEITLAGALDNLIRAAEYQMVDELGVMGDDDKKTIAYAKRALEQFKKAKGA